MSTIPSIPTVRRTIAVALTILFAITLAAPHAAGGNGGDHGVCDDGLWQKADWNRETDSWDWEDGPGWNDDAPASPVLTVQLTDEDGDPTTVGWTSSAYVEKVSVKASTLYDAFDGGYSGTVTGIDKTEDPADGQHAISHIVFCYGPEPPPAPTGSLTVVKEVVGDYDGEDAFEFAGTCQLPQFPAHVEFSLTDGDSWTFPEEIPGYLDGSPCEFTETDTNGADSVAYKLGDTELTPDADGKVHFTLSSTEDLVLTVTNTFEPERPQVLLEKAWFADTDDTVPIGIFRQTEDGWTLVQDGPVGYDPPADLEQPSGFDATVTYGEETYTVVETLPDGWQNIACPTDAPQPNGLGDFPYERPSGDDLELRTLDRLEVAPRVDTIRHTICNAAIPEPLVASIGLTKTPDVTTVTFAPADGDDETVTYTYVVTNTGETTLTDLVLVDDVLGTITLADTELEPGETTTGTATHVVTAADADAGQIVNEAEVTGIAPDETEVTAEDDATVLVEQVLPEVVAKPEITLEKTALVELDDNGRKVVVWNAATPEAIEITYEYTITNTGETTLTGITLVDDVLGTITLDDTTLGVGRSMTATAVHTVSKADAEAGEVTNVAVTTGTAPDGTVVDAEADETVLVGEVQAEVADKEAEQLPVTGAPITALGLLAALSLAAGTGLLRATTSRRG